MVEFDYQWASLPSKNIEYNEVRVDEFLRFTGLDKSFFVGKEALDAGCGNGRYTWAMQRLGASVDSIDISIEAIIKCRETNPNARQLDILDLGPKKYDFIFSFGVLHHMSDPVLGFNVLKDRLVSGGLMHIMVYGKAASKRYPRLRNKFRSLDHFGKIGLCVKLVERYGGDVHGWYDALNPVYNYSYNISEIIGWYKDAGFIDINVLSKPRGHVHINGVMG